MHVPTKFRKRPLVVEAVQLGTDNRQSILAWALSNGQVAAKSDAGSLLFRTPEGTMEARPGDWVIRGIKGEFYPCHPDVFERTYAPEDEQTNGSKD